MLGQSGVKMSFFTLLRALNRPLKFSCTDLVDLTGQNLLHSLCTRRREMVVDKTAGLRPTEELGCLRGWESFCLESFNIVIGLSQQREHI